MSSTSYPEPPASLRDLSLQRLEGDVAILASGSVRLEIAHINGVGWSMELRYDEAFAGVRRQAESGVQASLSRTPLRTEETASTVTLHIGDGERLEIDRVDSSFRWLVGDGVVFASCPAPFTAHPQQVTIPINATSRSFTDFSRQPWYSSGATPSHMVRFQYPRPDGTVLGVPGHTGECNRNGYRFHLWNWEMQPAQTPSRSPTHQSWPMLMHRATGGGWVGIFHDNPSQTLVDIGDFYKDRVTFESVTGNTRLYLCRGAAPADITQSWVRLLGTPLFPPLWAFGYQQCRWSYLSQQEVETVVAGFDEHDIPLDAVYLDIDYMDGYRVFTVNQQAFPDLPGMIRRLRERDIRTVCILDPGIKIDEQYDAYTELRDEGGYLRKPDGQPLVAKVWPGEVFLPNMWEHSVREWWSRRLLRFLGTFPMDGIWNDMNEPINWDGGPAVTSQSVGRDGTPVRGEWNHYGLRVSQATTEAWHAAKPQDRPLVITRSGYPGVQRFSVTWHGDNHAWWEHLRMAVDMAVSYALCGQFYSGPDVPGFSENAPADLAVRFFQLGSMLPMFRGHSMLFADRKEPYTYPQPHRDAIRDAILLRYRLIEEWYSGYARCLAQGRPPLEPVWRPDGSLERDSFLLFGKFLVCPVVQRDQCERLVWLPEGDWYRYGNPQERLEGGRSIVEDVRGFRMPLYVRAGSVVVEHEPQSRTRATMDTEAAFIAYPDRNGTAEGWRFRDVHAGADAATPPWTMVRVAQGAVTQSPAVPPGGVQ